MSKLQRFKDEIQRLPEKRNRADLVGDLEKYGSQMIWTLEKLTQTQNNSACIRVVFSDSDLKIVADKINQVGKIAQRLRKNLSDNIENIKNKKIDEKFAEIQFTVKSASNSLHEKWRVFLQTKIETYEKIVNAAANAKLSGSQTLTQTLNKLDGKLDSPPDNEEDARKIAEDLSSLSNSIETLGLKGKVGEFLTAAAAGNATAQMLLEKEVQDFIEQNNLWSAFSIKLG